MSERIVRLKDGSIAVCLDIKQSNAKYRYVRKGGSSSNIGRIKEGNGCMYVPQCHKEIWDTEFELDEADVVRDLRFQPNNYVKDSESGTVMIICAIPANTGDGDYTVNRIERWGAWSSSYTANDQHLVPSSKEEADVQVAERRKAWKEPQIG